MYIREQLFYDTLLIDRTCIPQERKNKMRRLKYLLISAFFLAPLLFGSPVYSFKDAQGEKTQECKKAAELMLELLDVEERAFVAATECLPMSTNPDCASGRTKELIIKAETLKKKVTEIARICLEQ